MKKNIFLAFMFAVPALAFAQTPFSFDSNSALPAMPPAPAVPAAVAVQKAAPHPAAPLMGNYRLTHKEAGSCYEELEIVPEEFGNTPLGNNIGIYGLPRGQGLIVSQVLEINGGLRFDRYENPMVILPFQSGFMGYRPRQADFDGSKLVYKTGELRKIKPFSIKKGEILEVVKDGASLKISEGTFEAEKVSFTAVCRYARVN